MISCRHSYTYVHVAPLSIHRWMWPEYKHLHLIFHTTLSNLVLPSNTFCFIAGFFFEINLFSPYPWRKNLVLFIANKMNILHSSNTYMTVFFHRAFFYPDLFPYYPRMQGYHRLVDSKHFHYFEISTEFLKLHFL